jgi:hypothetical protein
MIAPPITTPADTAASADVDVALAPAMEEHRGAEVDDDADRGDDHHHAAGHLGRRHQPLPRLERDRADRDEEEQRVEQRREDRRAAQAIGEALRRGALGELGAAPGDQQADDVGEIVARIGEQRHRTGEQPRNPLDQHEGEVERGAEHEGAAEIGRRMGVGVAVVVMVVRGHCEVS